MEETTKHPARVLQQVCFGTRVKINMFTSTLEKRSVTLPPFFKLGGTRVHSSVSSCISFKLESKVSGGGRKDEAIGRSLRIILHLFNCRDRSENHRHRITLVLATAFIP